MEQTTTGGAAIIADRFKLDTVTGNDTQGTENKALTVTAMVCALLAVAALGAVAALMYMHWDTLAGV